MYKWNPVTYTLLSLASFPQQNDCVILTCYCFINSLFLLLLHTILVSTFVNITSQDVVCKCFNAFLGLNCSLSLQKTLTYRKLLLGNLKAADTCKCFIKIVPFSVDLEDITHVELLCIHSHQNHFLPCFGHFGEWTQAASFIK